MASPGISKRTSSQLVYARTFTMLWGRTMSSTIAPSLMFWRPSPGIILSMHPANERRCYNVTLSLIGWVHTKTYPWISWRIFSLYFKWCEYDLFLSSIFGKSYAWHVQKFGAIWTGMKFSIHRIWIWISKKKKKKLAKLWVLNVQ